MSEYKDKILDKEYYATKFNKDGIPEVQAVEDLIKDPDFEKYQPGDTGRKPGVGDSRTAYLWTYVPDAYVRIVDDSIPAGSLFFNKKRMKEAYPKKDMDSIWENNIGPALEKGGSNAEDGTYGSNPKYGTFAKIFKEYDKKFEDLKDLYSEGDKISSLRRKARKDSTLWSGANKIWAQKAKQNLTMSISSHNTGLAVDIADKYKGSWAKHKKDINKIAKKYGLIVLSANTKEAGHVHVNLAVHPKISLFRQDKLKDEKEKSKKSFIDTLSTVPITTDSFPGGEYDLGIEPKPKKKKKFGIFRESNNRAIRKIIRNSLSKN